MLINNHFIILLNINTFYAFFLQKIKTYYLCLILTSFLDRVIREILGSVLRPPFLCTCCSAIRREEVCKQVGCERERLTLYINNTNFPLINMQQLKHIIFQDLLNEPRTSANVEEFACISVGGLFSGVPPFCSRFFFFFFFFFFNCLCIFYTHTTLHYQSLFHNRLNRSQKIAIKYQLSLKGSSS